MPNVIVPAASTLDAALELLKLLKDGANYEAMLAQLKSGVAEFQSTLDEGREAAKRLAAREVAITRREEDIVVQLAKLVAEQERITKAHETVIRVANETSAAATALTADQVEFKAMVSAKGPELTTRELAVVAREAKLAADEQDAADKQKSLNEKLAQLRQIAG